MALWSDLAVWRGPTPNRTRGGMNRYDGQVTHIAAGWFEGTISWQLNDSSNVSSHFVVGREWGQCAQLVDLDDAAWTQSDGNGEWISVENAGFPLGHRLWKPGWEQLSDWQIECNARLYARGHKEFGWPLQLTSHPDVQGLGYHGMGAENGYQWGHLHCPGEPIKAQLPLVLARAIEIVNGDDDMAWSEILTSSRTGPTSGDNAMLTIYDDVKLDVPKRHKELLEAVKTRPTVAITPEDRAAIVADLKAGLLDEIRAEIRDAVADLGEGGAAQVRAE